MTVAVGWLDPAQDCWDTNTLRLLLDGELYKHDLSFRHYAGYPNVDGAVVLIVPGRYYAQHTDQINLAIKRFVSVLMVVTSDEEGTFPCSNVLHDRIRFWIQTPRVGRSYPEGSRFIGVGFPPHANTLQPNTPQKATEVFLAGQKTHRRRVQAFEAVAAIPGAKLHESEGFTRGLEPAVYMSWMVESKIAPAPSGAVSPDSFRLYEALESHCAPVADDVSPVDGPTGYWRHLFPDAPFPILTDYASLPGYVEDALAAWPANANRIAAWWMREKRRYALDLKTDLHALGAL